MSSHDEHAFQPQGVAILGVGLLGGSVAKAVRRAWPECRIVGSSRKPDTRSMLVQNGIVDFATDSISECVADCELVVVAAPVVRIASMLAEVAASVQKNAVITDVGSTKANIVRTAETDAHARGHFVGAHPIAGSEKTGAENASEDLFDGKLTIITPTKNTDAKNVERVSAFWMALGSRVTCMDPAEHDEALAATSHMPHIASAALAQSLPLEFASLAGTGFRDATRIAAGDPQMWREIVEANADATRLQVGRLIDTLRAYQDAIAASDWERVERLFEEAQAAKREIDAQSSPQN